MLFKYVRNSESFETESKHEREINTNLNFTPIVSMIIENRVIVGIMYIYGASNSLRDEAVYSLI